MKKKRICIFGCGFWANYQIPGWLELEGVEIPAVFNRTKTKAEAIAKKFKIPRFYDNAEELLAKEEFEVADIITDVDTHLQYTKMAAKHGKDVVCQKPMAPNYADAKKIVQVCRTNNVKLFVNENFRWQAPIRAVKKVLVSGLIGEVFKVRVSFCSGFPVFDNQPFLAELEQFILTDIGSHILDICRFLAGDVKMLYCKTNRINPKIKGEDVANVFMEMKNGIHCYAEMSYASILEKEAFPQTLVLIEGSHGSIRLDVNFKLSVTTRQGTKTETVKPVKYKWIDPAYAVVHSSIVDAQRDILNGLRGGVAETSGDDNFKTVQLVWASYQSAATGKVIDMDKF
ncbi:MAG TPA: Gfo/Idh/MocA family oxidoreductase [bacterium]|nr:Gfo/Idh/MocA family oxidoreductase [bacterium]HPN45572.1 Gfo/Idh/MocA family oxidoreductase [bacterium]